MIEQPVLGPLLAEGKTKLMYAYPDDPNLAYMVSKDQITAGDGVRRNDQAEHRAQRRASDGVEGVTFAHASDYDRNFCIGALFDRAGRIADTLMVFGAEGVSHRHHPPDAPPPPNDPPPPEKPPPPDDPLPNDPPPHPEYGQPCRMT